MTIDDRQVGPPERLHPLFLLGGVFGKLRGLIGAYVAIGVLAARGMLGTALIGMALLVGITLVSLFLYWRRFEYRVGQSEIRIDSGIVSRTHRSIPFDRVQDVDIVQGPIARIVGLARVKFETGGSAGGDAEDGVLPAISLERAEQLRSLVRSHRSGSPETVTQPEEDIGEPVFAMSNGRLLLAGLFNFSLAVFAGLIGLTQTAGDVIGFDPLSRRFWQSLLNEAGPAEHFLVENQLVSVIAGLMTLILVGIATGVIRTGLRDYGFRLDRTEAGLRRRRGLLTLTDVTLPVRRAQAAIVVTGPVRDRFGWSELKLQSLARDEGGSGDHSLAPLATDEEVGQIVEQLGWRRLPTTAGWSRVSLAYVGSLALGLSPLILIAAAQAFVFPPLGLAFFAAIAGALAVRWVAWRRTCYTLDGDRLLIRTGWWRRRTLLLPLRRIQSLDLTQSFVSRWFGTASLVFGVAGGSGFSAHAIPALDEKIARDLRSRLLSLPS